MSETVPMTDPYGPPEPYPWRLGLALLAVAGLVIGLVFLVFAAVDEGRDYRRDCESRGGVVVKEPMGGAKCIDKEAVLP